MHSHAICFDMRSVTVDCRWVGNLSSRAIKATPAHIFTCFVFTSFEPPHFLSIELGIVEADIIISYLQEAGYHRRRCMWQDESS